MNEITYQQIERKINNVEHPEIASTLKELGMIKDVILNEEENTISVTLVLPMMTIPVEIRDMLVNLIVQALRQLGTTYNLKIYLAEMNDEQREKFFSLSKQNWKL
ncbi:MAG TPA: hypothetical protein ENK91_13860 [Bacteroidetes bacterium]|nr:hypothetical protein [Bacteroidota bacterium]